MVTVPFGPDSVRTAAKSEYRKLTEKCGFDEVLVLTASPTSTTTFRDILEEECPGAALPDVKSVIVHATEVINRNDDRAILSDAMRRELLHRFLSDREWESEYLQRASVQDSFDADAAQLLETAAWQDLSFDTTPELQEFAEARDAFHGWLDTHDHLERGQMIAEATTQLADEAVREMVIDADAILVIEFEEFVDLDRQYLQRLATDRELVCLVEEDASIRRTWTETGVITDYVTFSDERTVEGTEPRTRPAVAASYLAKGAVSTDPETGEVRVLTADTADEEVHRVTDEIERLCETADIDYSDIAIGLKHSGQAVIEVLDVFRQAGIPTTSATVVGFGDDPAIRELLCAVHELAGEDDFEIHSSPDVVLPADLRRDLSEMSHLGEAIRKWATSSRLKERIAREADPLDARAQFGDVRRAFTMADFLEETAFLEANWETLAGMLRRAHEAAPQENQTSAIDNTGGVRVDHLQALKNSSFRVVFLLDLTDSTYPGKPSFSNVFPQERARRLPDYPGVTRLDPGDVSGTFPTDSTRSSRPFRRYHVEHARRQLAVGAAIATDRTYLCLHSHEGSALEERVQPSRFLASVYRELPWLSESPVPDIASERTAEEYLLSRLDRSLSEIRRANSQDVTVSLDEIEEEFAEIQTLLDASGDRGDQLRAALQARLDFVAGRVRRE